MSDHTAIEDNIQPPQSPQERRLNAIRLCFSRALNKAQQAIEDKHMKPDLRNYLENYMGGYCRYLPEICDIESARDFIACVTYGMSVEAINLERGTKLLYAAQVALSAFRPGKDEKPAPPSPLRFPHCEIEGLDSARLGD
jgi:hypothetical protein